MDGGGRDLGQFDHAFHMKNTKEKDDLNSSYANQLGYTMGDKVCNIVRTSDDYPMSASRSLYCFDTKKEALDQKRSIEKSNKGVDMWKRKKWVE